MKLSRVGVQRIEYIEQVDNTMEYSSKDLFEGSYKGSIIVIQRSY